MVDSLSPGLLRAQAAAIRAIAALPARVQRALVREGPHVVDGQTLDPTLQVIRALRRARREPGLVEPTVDAGRRRFTTTVAALARRPTPVAAVRDLEVGGGVGALAARHYAPASGAGEPLLVFLHGGGFVIGDVASHDEACRLLCAHARVHVLSVAYRLAPEHPFPAAVDDASAALAWAQAHAASLGADPARVGVGGDSAGGNLATVAARLAAAADVPPAAQLLVYPATDWTRERPSHALFGDSYFLSNEDRAAFSALYAGRSGVDAADARLSPLLARDPRAQAPALVVTAGFDVLRDEGEAYADALRATGTRVVSWREPTLGHGFVNLTGVVPAARRAVERIAREWRGLLGETRAPTGGA